MTRRTTRARSGGSIWLGPPRPANALRNESISSKNSVPPANSVPTAPRLWLISLAFFAGGFAGRVAINVGVGNVAWSCPIEVEIQWYAYWTGLIIWMLWLAIQANPQTRAPGCLSGLGLAFASVIAIGTSIPK